MMQGGSWLRTTTAELPANLETKFRIRVRTGMECFDCGPAGPVAGCGWPWQFKPPEPQGVYDVFVSYAGDDFDTYIRPLVDSLREAGLSVWLDKTEITWETPSRDVSTKR